MECNSQMKTKFLGLSGIKLDWLTPQDLGDCSGKRPRNRATEYGFRPRDLRSVATASTIAMYVITL